VQTNETITIDEATATDRVRRIIGQVAELDPDQVDLDAHFYEDMLCDSLQQLEIVVQVERGFGIKLSDVEAAALHRGRDALAALREKGVLHG
jgi:acyl carrier protein